MKQRVFAHSGFIYEFGCKDTKYYTAPKSVVNTFVFRDDLAGFIYDPNQSTNMVMGKERDGNREDVSGSQWGSSREWSEGLW